MGLKLFGNESTQRYVHPDFYTSEVCIYVLIDPRDGRVRYVGKTDNPRRRLNVHISTVMRGAISGRFAMWIKDIVLSGRKPEMIALEYVEEGKWQDREIDWINYFRIHGASLLNRVRGGNAPRNRRGQVIFSIETRKRMSQSAKGKVITEQTRKLISERMMGRKFSQEHKRRMSESRQSQWPPPTLGFRHTEETKKKIKNALIGKNKGKRPWLGKKHSPETIEKMRIIAKNRKRR